MTSEAVFISPNLGSIPSEGIHNVRGIEQSITTTTSTLIVTETFSGASDCCFTKIENFVLTKLYHSFRKLLTAARQISTVPIVLFCFCYARLFCYINVIIFCINLYHLKFRYTGN